MRSLGRLRAKLKTLFVHIASTSFEITYRHR